MKMLKIVAVLLVGAAGIAKGMNDCPVKQWIEEERKKAAQVQTTVQTSESDAKQAACTCETVLLRIGIANDVGDGGYEFLHVKVPQNATLDQVKEASRRCAMATQNCGCVGWQTRDFARRLANNFEKFTFEKTKRDKEYAAEAIL